GSSRASPYAWTYATLPSNTAATTALGTPVSASTLFAMRSMLAGMSFGSGGAGGASRGFEHAASPHATSPLRTSPRGASPRGTRARTTFDRLDDCIVRALYQPSPWRSRAFRERHLRHLASRAVAAAQQSAPACAPAARDAMTGRAIECACRRA